MQSESDFLSFNSIDEEVEEQLTETEGIWIVKSDATALCY